jgi:hypothetical protein
MRHKYDWKISAGFIPAIDQPVQAGRSSGYLRRGKPGTSQGHFPDKVSITSADNLYHYSSASYPIHPLNCFFGSVKLAERNAFIDERFGGLFRSICYFSFTNPIWSD